MSHPTQLYRDYDKPRNKDPVINQSVFHGKSSGSAGLEIMKDDAGDATIGSEFVYLAKS